MLVLPIFFYCSLVAQCKRTQWSYNACFVVRRQIFFSDVSKDEMK